MIANFLKNDPKMTLKTPSTRDLSQKMIQKFKGIYLNVFYIFRANFIEI
jgi:hypothetical protein